MSDYYSQSWERGEESQNDSKGEEEEDERATEGR